jgi:hypothetical protein
VRTLVALVGLAVVLAGCTTAHRHNSASTTQTVPTTPSATSTPSPSSSPPATSLGPSGLRAHWVQQENARPGSSAWRIPVQASSAIEGFADKTYAADGQTVRLYVSTPAASFHVEAYRMGYYGGAGARQVWRSPTNHGGVQRQCPRAPRTNLVSCARWHPSLFVRLTDDFVPGDYLFKLFGSGGQQSYVPLTVWDPHSHSAYLVKNDVFTWQAWNSYGGYDFYAGVGACPPGVYPLCSRARVVSFDRPYADARGAGDFFASERPLVEFIEQQGLDVSYVTDVTLVEHPGVLLQHKALLSLGHDECWDLRERRAAVAAEHRGVDLAFFGASAILRHVRVHPSRLGPNREVIDYRDPSEDPLNGHGDPLDVTANTWASPPARWAEDAFVGEGYVGFRRPETAPTPFVVADASAWIFAGTHAHNGTAVPGVIASDVDGFNPGAHPAGLQILGHSPVPLAGSEANGRHWGPVYYSDMTYYTDPVGKAGVFDSGTNNWIAALAPCAPATRSCPAPFVRQVTGNLLRRFASGPAGAIAPSHANWRHIPQYS